MPGRWTETREPNEHELQATNVLVIPIDEASAKIRTGPPIDDVTDYELPYWAGEIPLRVYPGDPIVDPKLADSISMPEHVKQYLAQRRYS